MYTAVIHAQQGFPAFAIAFSSDAGPAVVSPICPALFFSMKDTLNLGATWR